MPGPRIPEPQKELLIARLGDIHRELGTLPNYLAVELTDTFDVGRAIVYRYFADVTAGDPTPAQQLAQRGRFEFTPEMLPFLSSSYSGTKRQAWKALGRQFPDANLPWYPNFTKLLKSLDKGLLGRLEEGWDIDSRAHAAEPHTLQRSPYPGWRWAVDVKDLRIDATPDNRWAPCDANVINILDDFSNKVLVSMPGLGPVSGAHIVVALAQACHVAGGHLRRLHPDLAGGMAETVHSDNGGETPTTTSAASSRPPAAASRAARATASAATAASSATSSTSSTSC